MITLDGSIGEGGGQILRTALSLSAITQQPFRIENIRAKRKKPGLLRQHLTAVLAAARISNAQTLGAEMNSGSLEFIPQQIQAGQYKFSIGSAGSTGLVLQTVLPILMCADAPSTLLLEGGTHNPLAPPFDFLQGAFLPLLARMGVRVELNLIRPGFFPAGGGQLEVRITPCERLQPLHIPARGKTQRIAASAYIAGIPLHVAERELAVVKKKLQPRDADLHVCGLANDYGPGNMLAVTVESEQLTEVFCGFGAHGVSAEAVAGEVCRQAKRYLDSGAAVDEYLADQLLLPLALAGSGSFTTTEISAHAQTNAEVIQAFLDVSIRFVADGSLQQVMVES